MAAEMGGNCVLTQKGQIVEYEGVKIIGYYDWTSRMSTQSSDLFSKNIYHLLTELIKLPENKSNNASNLEIDLEDEIQKSMCVIRNG